MSLFDGTGLGQGFSATAKDYSNLALGIIRQRGLENRMQAQQDKRTQSAMDRYGRLISVDKNKYSPVVQQDVKEETARALQDVNDEIKNNPNDYYNYVNQRLSQHQQYLENANRISQQHFAIQKLDPDLLPNDLKGLPQAINNGDISAFKGDLPLSGQIVGDDNSVSMPTQFKHRDLTNALSEQYNKYKTGQVEAISKNPKVAGDKELFTEISSSQVPETEAQRYALVSQGKPYQVSLEAMKNNAMGDPDILNIAKNELYGTTKESQDAYTKMSVPERQAAIDKLIGDRFKNLNSGFSIKQQLLTPTKQTSKEGYTNNDATSYTGGGDPKNSVRFTLNNSQETLPLSKDDENAITANKQKLYDALSDEQKKDQGITDFKSYTDKFPTVPTPTNVTEMRMAAPVGKALQQTTIGGVKVQPISVLLDNTTGKLFAKVSEKDYNEWLSNNKSQAGGDVYKTKTINGEHIVPLTPSDFVGIQSTYRHDKGILNQMKDAGIDVSLVNPKYINTIPSHSYSSPAAAPARIPTTIQKQPTEFVHSATLQDKSKIYSDDGKNWYKFNGKQAILYKP